MALLSLRNVTRRFGGIVALDGVSFDVLDGPDRRPDRPERRRQDDGLQRDHAALHAERGRGRVRRRDLLKTPVHGIVAPRDRAHLPERRALQDDDRARQRARRRAHARPATSRPRRSRRSTTSGWRAIAQRPVAGLPFGTLKRVELARALVAQPKLLLLDEPAGGLNHEEVEELGRFIQKIRDDRELTVLLVEHHMNLVMGISDHVHVLNFGREDRRGPAGRGAREPGRDRGLPRHRRACGKRRRRSDGREEPDGAA